MVVIERIYGMLEFGETKGTPFLLHLCKRMSLGCSIQLTSLWRSSGAEHKVRPGQARC